MATIEVAKPELPPLGSLSDTPSAALGDSQLQELFSTIQQSFPHLRTLDQRPRQGGERKRQCHRSERRLGFGDLDLMSRRSPTSDPTSSPTHHRAGSAPVVVHSQSLSNEPVLARPAPAERTPSASSGAPASSISSAEQRQAASAGSGEARPIRSIGVHNILNPVPSDASQTQGNTQGVETGGAASSSSRRTIGHSGAEARISSREALHGPVTGVAAGVPSTQAARRILTPQSPSWRAASLGRLSLPGSLHAYQQPPLLPPQSRAYGGEIGSFQPPGLPSAPTPPAASRLGGSYGFPPVSATPPQGRRASVGPSLVPPSQSASPSTSYSSYSQAGQTPPGQQHGLVATQPPQVSFRIPSYNPPSHGTGAPQSSVSLGLSMPPSVTAMAPGQQQMLTLDTEHGPIQVPLDVQAASKVADVKRKKNAGASARFRQRRKEKERQASHTIAKLEQQIRDANEERDFYRQERDYFRQIVMAMPGQAPHVRPLSPARRRSMQTGPGPMSEGMAPIYEAGSSVEPEQPPEIRPSAFAPSVYSLPLPTGPQVRYPVPGFAPLHPTSSQPPPGHSAGQTGSAHPLSGPPADPYEPYVPGRHDRGW